MNRGSSGGIHSSTAVGLLELQRTYILYSDRVPESRRIRLRRWRVCFDELVVIVRDRVPGVPSDILDHWTGRTVAGRSDGTEQSGRRGQGVVFPCPVPRIVDVGQVAIQAVYECVSSSIVNFSFRVCCGVTSSLTLRCNE